MIEPVTQQRWQEAQIAEAATASYSREQCQRATRNIFDYLSMSFDQGGKYIVEVGCGPYPSTSYCENVRTWVRRKINETKRRKRLYQEEANA